MPGASFYVLLTHLPVARFHLPGVRVVLTMLSGRAVLSLFFALPPPLLTIPTGALALFIVFMVMTSTIAIAAALTAVTRVRPASVLREP